MTPEEIATASAEAMWATDSASQGLGMELLEVGPGTATISMRVQSHMVNGHGIGHGGYTFTLADSTFAFACNSYNRITVAAGGQIRFRRPVHLDDVLTAAASEVSREGRDGTYSVTVSNQDGVVVAEFTGTSKEIGGTLF